MREMPFSVNVGQEQEKIEIENMRQSLLSSIQAYSQAIPGMAAQGQDPSDIVSKIANVIKLRQKGTTIEEAIAEVFAPAPAPAPTQQVPPVGEAPMVEQTSPAPAAPSAGGALPEPTPEPDIQTILSSLTASGKAGGRVVTRG